MHRHNYSILFLAAVVPLLAAGCGDDPSSPPEDPNWHPLPGLNNLVTELVVYDGDLIAGGFFTRVGGVSASGIARWDGSSWSPIGEGLQGGLSDLGGVLSMVVYEGHLVVAGFFDHAGGVPANNIAQWDGSVWSALGSGISVASLQDGLFSMAAHDGSLYVGGSFLDAGSVPVHHIARWDGGAWHAAGDGVSGTQTPGVGSMALYQGDLVAGGNFSSIDGVDADHIARWNGVSWAPLGTGIEGHQDSVVVVAQTVLGDNLYAGGVFRKAGGVAASNLACWDGAAWSPLGPGTNDRVEALCRYGNDLIAGGTFTRAGLESVGCIARWNGASWSGLGQGVAGGLGGMTVVSALVVFDGSVIVAGNFTTAGGKSAGYIARWED
jgi:hypothetical protein